MNGIGAVLALITMCHASVSPANMVRSWRLPLLLAVIGYSCLECCRQDDFTARFSSGWP